MAVSQSGRAMAAVSVTVALLAAVQALEAAVVTLNSQHPDLLPSDCGRRLVTLADVSQSRIVGPGNITAYHGQFPWQARIESIQERGTTLRAPVRRHRHHFSTRAHCGTLH